MGLLAAASAALAMGAVAMAVRVQEPDVFAHVEGILRLPGIVPTLVLTLMAPVITNYAIGATKDAFLAKGFGGRDLLKGPRPDGESKATAAQAMIPESLGLPTSIIYCLLLFCYIPFRYGVRDGQAGEYGELKSNADGGWSGDMHGTVGFPHHELAVNLSALLSILSSIMLGFLDDVFDIRWRLKMPIPILASLPMLVVYQAGQGGTSVVVPGWPAMLRTLLGSNIVNLGPLYHLFILLLSTFCVHSINILAGINGVEVGQALIIALSLCCNDLLYLDPHAGMPGSFASVELRDRHIFSLALLLPFCGCCIALLSWNKYPARVFVGDTFCYFAGQVIACAGVLGHFSKTLLLFFAPQLLNFALSLPQLSGLTPCPRHRVPNVDMTTMALHPSMAHYGRSGDKTSKEAGPLAILILRLFAAFRLVHLVWDEGSDAAVTRSKRKTEANGTEQSHQRRLAATSNLTILNAILVFRGVQPLPTALPDCAHRKGSHAARRIGKGPRISERGLWWHVMVLQVVCSCLAFAIRYWLAAIVFP